MSERALELLALPNDGRARLVLDLGCGSGLSGGVIAASGNYWVGMDISRHMLGISMMVKNQYFRRRTRKAQDPLGGISS
jgi:18S rRNA (guanine1575-N7)-methyltransferase